MSYRSNRRRRPRSGAPSVVALPLLSAIVLIVPAQAEDRVYVSEGNILMNYYPSGGFAERSPQENDRAVYSTAGAGASTLINARTIGGALFTGDYTGTGFDGSTPNVALYGRLTLNGINGIGVESRVNQTITLFNTMILGASQEWLIDSASGSVTQATNVPNGRVLNLQAHTLTLNPVQAGNSFLLNNPISGTGGLRVTGAGSVVMSAANTYSGGTTLLGGTLSVAQESHLGDTTGALNFEGGRLQVTGDTFATTARPVTWSAAGGSVDITEAGHSFTLTQALTGGQLDKFGPGTLILSGASDFGTGATIHAGGLTLTGAGAIGEAARLVNQGAFDITATTAGATIGSLTGSGTVTLGAQTLTLAAAQDSFAGSFSGTGGLTLRAGTQTLTGDSPGYTGATTIEGGTLRVNADLAGSAVTVLGGTLGGTGHVGATQVAAGGTIAPGSSIGTLTVNGDYSQAAGAVYQAELDPASSASDRIVVTGAAQLAPGALVNASFLPAGTPAPGTVYTVLTATGGLTGSYALTGATAFTPFLSLVADHDASSAYLRVVQTFPLETVAQTGNQAAVAQAVDSLPVTAPLPVALLNSPSEVAARYGLDLASGEIHAAVKGRLLADSRFLREGALARLRAADCVTEATTAADCDRTPGRFTAWAQGYGSWAQASGGQGARISSSTGGFLLGVDAPLLQSWRLGVVTGYGRTHFDLPARQSTVEADTFHLGVYGGGQWGALSLRAGAGYSWHDLSTSRWVTLPGLATRLRGSQNAGTAQAFGELGYRLRARGVAMEPFANLAFTHLGADGFAERGHGAALMGRASNSNATFTTLGARFSSGFTLAGYRANATATLGWRHAFGDLVPSARMAFAGSTDFTIRGVPLARDALVAEAGLELALSERVSVGLSYQGQLARDVTDQSIRGVLRARF